MVLIILTLVCIKAMATSQQSLVDEKKRRGKMAPKNKKLRSIKFTKMSLQPQKSGHIKNVQKEGKEKEKNKCKLVLYRLHKSFQ